MRKKNIIKNYWNDLDNRLESLMKNGVVKLKSIKDFELDTISKETFKEMKNLTFLESGLNHKNFLNFIEMDKYLSPKLLNIARKFFNYKGDLTNKYLISRKVEPGNIKEKYRLHFDSHIFTIVFPIKIPNSLTGNNCGELIYFKNARSHPNNEILNIIDKINFKRFASKKGIEKLSKNFEINIEKFENYEPLLFFGKTTLHTNYALSSDCSGYRLTMLTHLFDDTPKYGLGNLLRLLRNR